MSCRPSSVCKNDQNGRRGTSEAHTWESALRRHADHRGGYLADGWVNDGQLKLGPIKAATTARPLHIHPYAPSRVAASDQRETNKRDQGHAR
jgi:hypothetical protein